MNKIFETNPLELSKKALEIYLFMCELKEGKSSLSNEEAYQRLKNYRDNHLEDYSDAQDVIIRCKCPGWTVRKIGE